MESANPTYNHSLEYMNFRNVHMKKKNHAYSIVDAEYSDDIRFERDCRSCMSSLVTNYRNVYHGNDMPLVDVGSCSLLQGAGKGVFANTFIAKGSFVTAYGGRIIPPRSSSSGETCTPQNDERCAKKRKRSMSNVENVSENQDDDIDMPTNYNYIYEMRNQYKIDGLFQNHSGPWWSSRGVAHMINDALHPDVSGKESNCEFVEIDVPICASSQRRSVTRRRADFYKTRVYIVSTRDVYPGEELYVDYGLSYWLSKFRTEDQNTSKDRTMTNTMYGWLSIHYTLERIISSCCGTRVKLTEYHHFIIGSCDEEENRDAEVGTAKYCVEFRDARYEKCNCSLPASTGTTDRRDDEVTTEGIGEETRDNPLPKKVSRFWNVKFEKTRGDVLDIRISCCSCGKLLNEREGMNYPSFFCSLTLQPDNEHL